MIAITKSMIALSAVVSAGFVTVYDVTGTPAGQQPNAVVSQRFPTPGEMFVPVIVKSRNTVTVKGDRSPLVADNCERQDWPYIAQSCLVSVDGKPVRKISRIVTVERRTGDDSSELTRVPVTTIANR